VTQSRIKGIGNKILCASPTRSYPDEGPLAHSLPSPDGSRVRLLAIPLGRRVGGWQNNTKLFADAFRRSFSRALVVRKATADEFPSALSRLESLSRCRSSIFALRLLRARARTHVPPPPPLATARAHPRSHTLGKSS
jgi:hypothetical protein